MIENIESIYNQRKGQSEILQKQYVNYQNELGEVLHELEISEQVQVLLQIVAKATQEKIKYKIEKIVNLALSTVFEKKYKFILNFIIQREKTECEILLENDQGILMKPMQSNGGGLLDIISFALRVSLLLLSENNKIIILDEPFKFLSQNYQTVASEILKELSIELGIQFIIVTHINDLKAAADKIITVKKIKDESFVN